MKGEQQPIALAVKVGFVLLALGCLAWLWTGEWRWAVTGLVALLVGAVVGAQTARSGGVTGDTRRGPADS